MPEIYLIDDPAPNAFAVGRKPEMAAVAVTTGLLNILNRDELQGVVAHEIGHIVNRDTLFMSMIGVMLGTIVMLSEIARRTLFFGGGRRRSRSSSAAGGQAQLIILIVGLVTDDHRPDTSPDYLSGSLPQTRVSCGCLSRRVHTVAGRSGKRAGENHGISDQNEKSQFGHRTHVYCQSHPKTDRSRRFPVQYSSGVTKPHTDSPKHGGRFRVTLTTIMHSVKSLINQTVLACILPEWSIRASPDTP